MAYLSQLHDETILGGTRWTVMSPTTILLLLLLLLPPFEAKAETIISSNIYSSTTWTLANSPYRVTGQISITSATVTIQPGVVVKFNANTFLYLSAGTLNAAGEPGNPVTFTSMGLRGIEWVI